MEHEAIRTVLWGLPTQAGFFQALGAAAKLSVVAAGSPVRGQSGQLSAELGSKSFDDLRALLAETDVPLVIIGASEQFGSGAEDVRAVVAARGRGVQVASLEPIPGSALELSAAGWAGAVGAIRFLGLPRRGRPVREAAESLESFGSARTILIESWGASVHGSLGARLFGAIEMALSLLGEPESVAADFRSTSVGGVPGLALSQLHGDMTVRLRAADGRIAVIAASNQAGRWNAGATLLSDKGRLRFYDDGFEWITPQGRKQDELRLGARREGPAPDHAVRAIADSITRLMDASVPEAPVDITAVLRVAQAALLSARTGQPESPSTIERMMAVGDTA